MRDKVLLHIGQGFHQRKSLANEMIIKTIQSKRTIRINVYDNGKVIMKVHIVFRRKDMQLRFVSGMLDMYVLLLPVVFL